MKLKIEIDDIEKSLIESEIRETLGPILETKDEKIIDQVMISKNFDATISELRGRKYSSRKTNSEGLAMGKTLSVGGEVYIVIRPELFREDQINSQIRKFHYLHEGYHACLIPNFSILHKENINYYILDQKSKEQAILWLLEYIMDEYLANRNTFEFIHSEWEITDTFFDWLKPLVTGLKRKLDSVDRNVKKVRSRYSCDYQDVSNQSSINALQQLIPIIGGTSQNVFLLLSLKEGLDDTLEMDLDINDPWYKYDPLVDYARDKYKNEDPTFEDGKKIIDDYFKLFGLYLREENSKLLMKINSK